MFLISAPLVVLYTAGYRFDLNTGRIVHTGVLNVSSIPRGADVWIGEEKQSEKTRAVLDDVYPGPQIIRIEKNGFTSWEKEIDIESRETTFIVNALLFFDGETSIEDDREIMLFKRSGDFSKLAYLISEGSWVELWVSEGFAQSETLLTRLPNEIGTDYAISWSSDDEYILLETSTTVVLVDAIDGSNPALPAIVQTAETLLWDAHRSNVLYAQTAVGTYAITMDQNEPELLPFDAQTVTHPGEYIALSEGSDRMVLSRFEGETASIITYLPIGTYAFHPAPSGLILLEDTQRGRIILVDTHVANQPILLNEDASQWDWNQDETQLAYTDGFDLEVYTREAHSTQTITRQSEKIQGLMWYPLGDALLYESAGIIQAMELDSRDGHEVTMLTGGEIETFWTDDDGEFLFIHGSIDEQSGVHSKRLQR